MSSHRRRTQAQYRMQMKRGERKEDRPDVAAVARRIPRRVENHTGGGPFFTQPVRRPQRKKNSEAADEKLAQENDDGDCCDKKSCEKKKSKNNWGHRSVSD